jgi:hypothetical protein
MKRLKEKFPDMKPEDYTSEMRAEVIREQLLYIEQLNQDLINQEENVASLKQIYAELNEEFKFLGGQYQAFVFLNNTFDTLINNSKLLEESSLGITSIWSDALVNMKSTLTNVISIINREGVKSWRAYTTAGVGGLEVIGSVLNGLSEQMDEATLEGFEQQKKLQIAATVMNTLASIMGAWNSAMAIPAPGSYIYGATMTAMLGSLGAIQAQKIADMDFEGEKSVSSTVSSSALASTLIAPTQYSNAVQRASTESAIKDTKVYVLESDITRTIGKVQVQEAENIY